MCPCCIRIVLQGSEIMYQHLKKGKRYGFKSGKKVRSGEYIGRYKNFKTKNWHYKIQICYGMYWTPVASKTKITWE